MQRKGIFRAFILPKLFWVSPVSIPERCGDGWEPGCASSDGMGKCHCSMARQKRSRYLVSENLLSEGL